MSFDSRLLRPICSNSMSANWALVSAGVSRLSTEKSMVARTFSWGWVRSNALAGSNRRNQLVHHGFHRGFNLLFGQRGFVAVEREAHGQAAVGRTVRRHRILGQLG